MWAKLGCLDKSWVLPKRCKSGVFQFRSECSGLDYSSANGVRKATSCYAMLQICRQQRPRKLGSRGTLLSMVVKVNSIGLPFMNYE